MPLTNTALMKLGLILASHLCFSLYLWFAVIQLYLPFLPATDLFAYNYFYISPHPGLILPALGESCISGTADRKTRNHCTFSSQFS